VLDQAAWQAYQQAFVPSWKDQWLMISD
jgi:hypothetical protein